MATHLASTLILTLAGMVALTGCDNSTETTQDVTVSAASIANNTIDWTSVASDEKPANRTDYKYPFALDSQSVRDYADYFQVNDKTAQHNLTVSMASNEALSKILNQLGMSYTSHELTDGETVELIIHTKPEVNASRYDYVFSEDFAKGLVLPIVIVPDGKKDETLVNPHEEVAE